MVDENHEVKATYRRDTCTDAVRTAHDAADSSVNGDLSIGYRHATFNEKPLGSEQAGAK